MTQQHLPATEPTLWRAVLDRDAGLDGAFVYAVETTGIYCRPTCASRRPRRQNVRFFVTPAAAVTAGFRACRRCKPEGAARDPARDAVVAACRHIEASDESIPTLAELGVAVGLSPFHLQRVFKRLVGVSPRQYAAARRADRLKLQLKNGERIAEALYGAGYGSSSRLYESAPDRLGMTPGAYRNGGAGEEIRYATARTPLGALIVAATPRGICGVRLGARASDLTAELRREFAGATIRRAASELAGELQALADYLSGTASWPRLPYDVRATAFQQRVWQAIRAVPEGATVSYGDLARKIGQPKAARAVARACAANPVALVVPCHRVVPQAGGHGGYRWGSERKKALLELESAT